jgi:hypothetical protein
MWVNRIVAASARPVPAVADDESISASGDDSRRWLAFAGLAIIAVAAIGAGYGLWARHRVAGDAPRVTPPASSSGSAINPPAQPASISAAGLVSPAAPIDAAAKSPAAFGALKALRPTRVLLRDAENTTTERSLAAGESLELESQPIYLGASAADVELTIGGVAVDISRFVDNGEVRIGAGDFDALVQGASPIPAPTPAAVR